MLIFDQKILEVAMTSPLNDPNWPQGLLIFVTNHIDFGLIT